MKVAIVYICTGKYQIFFDNFYNTCESNFLNDNSKHYFVWSEKETDKNNVTNIFRESKGFPYDSLMRFHFFLEIESELKKFDYVFFFNSNTVFKNKLKFDEIPKSDLVCFTGLGHERYKRFPCFFPYERNKKSNAYIPRLKYNYKYVSGAIFGGKTGPFLDLCHRIKNWIDEDDMIGILPIFHDESYLNKYHFLYSDKISLMNYIYCISEETANIKQINAKIVFESKEKYGDYFIKRKRHLSSHILHLFNKLTHALRWYLNF